MLSRMFEWWSRDITVHTTNGLWFMYRVGFWLLIFTGFAGSVTRLVDLLHWLKDLK